MKRSFKIGGIIVSTLVIIILAILIALPSIVKNYAEEHSQELIGRNLTIDDIDINLFSGNINIDGLVLKEADTTQNFVSFDRLSVKISLFDLLRNKVNLKKIHLINANINIWQNNQEFNFSDIIQKFAKEDSSETDTVEEESKWEILLNDIQLKECRISYQDKAINSQFKLNDINLQIPAIYFSNQLTAGGLNLNFEEGGSLSTQLKYDMESSNFDLELLLNQFNLNSIFPYVKSFIQAKSLDGYLNTDLHLSGNLNHLLQSNIYGNIQLDSFSLRDNKNVEVVRFDQSGVIIEKLNIDSGYVHLKKASLSNNHTEVCLEANNSINLLNMVIQDTTSNKEPEENYEAKKMTFIVDEIDLSNLSIAFTDKTLKVPFRYKLEKMGLHSSNFATNKTNELVMKGNVGKTGTLFSKWKVNMDSLPDMDLLIHLSNVSLSEFSAYTQPMFGYQITNGNLTFVSQNIIRHNILTGLNKMDIHKCDMEKIKSEDKAQFNVPLKTALFIIKDKNDHINMDIPVKGDISSPEFSYGKIILKTFTNLLIKIAAAPFTSIGNTIGLGKKDYSGIDIDASVYDLTAEEYQTLNEIADMMLTKPELKLIIHQNINYTKAIEKTALFNLKKAYYLSQHPEKKDIKLDLLDIDAINKINETDKNLTLFADSIDNEKAANVNIADKAIDQFGTIAELKIIRMAEGREKLIQEYLSERKGLNPTQIKIETQPYDSTQIYEGKDRLEISVEPKETQVETQQ